MAVIHFPQKTARFSVVVAKAGRPSVHLALTDPAKDPDFKRLIAQNRVMTVTQRHRGGGADLGVVGFTKTGAGQLLVFPKPLKRFADRRIVGIDYDLLADATSITGSVADLPRRRKVTKAPDNSSRGAAKEPSDSHPKIIHVIPPAPNPEPLPVPAEPLTLQGVLNVLRDLRRKFKPGTVAEARESLNALIVRLQSESKTPHAR